MGTSRYWIICGVSMVLALGSAPNPTGTAIGAEPSEQPPDRQASPSEPDGVPEGLDVAATQPASGVGQDALPDAVFNFPQPNLATIKTNSYPAYITYDAVVFPSDQPWADPIQSRSQTTVLDATLLRHLAVDQGNQRISAAVALPIANRTKQIAIGLFPLASEMTESLLVKPYPVHAEAHSSSSVVSGSTPSVAMLEGGSSVPEVLQGALASSEGEPGETAQPTVTDSQTEPSIDAAITDTDIAVEPLLGPDRSVATTSIVAVNVAVNVVTSVTADPSASRPETALASLASLAPESSLEVSPEGNDVPSPTLGTEAAAVKVEPQLDSAELSAGSAPVSAQPETIADNADPMPAVTSTDPSASEVFTPTSDVTIDTMQSPSPPAAVSPAAVSPAAASPVESQTTTITPPGNASASPNAQDQLRQGTPAVAENQPLRFSGDPVPLPDALISNSEPGILPPVDVDVPEVPIADPNRPYTPPPDYLNPIANPLQFPTQPQEVTITGTQPITLQQAIELARRNNRPLQVVERQLESSRLALKAAEASRLPSVDLNSNLTYQDSASSRISNQNRQGLNALLGSQDTTSTTLNGTVEMTYNLDTSGQRSATIAAAERQVRASELTYETQLEALRLDVATDYYNLQQADQQVEISQQAVTNAEASLKDAKALERAGVGTRFDVLRSQVQLANSRQNLISAISQQQVSRRQLAQRLSIPQTVDISAADPVEISGLWTLSLEESIVLAFKNRAELEQQLVQRDIADSQRQAALAAQRPQLVLFANVTGLDIISDNVGGAVGYAAGARLNWNLFDGGATAANAAQQEVNREIAELNFADTRNNVRFQVEQAYFNLRANFENIQTAATAVVQADESLRLARLRFTAGVGTQTEVINAETDLTNAQVNRLRAILDYNRSLASLKRSISNLPNTSGDSALLPTQ